MVKKYMIKYNISKPKKYTDKNTGQEKTFWQNIGTMTEFPRQDGSISRILEIPAIGLEANIFPIEPKEPKQNYGNNRQSNTVPKENTIVYAEELSAEEIPF